MESNVDRSQQNWTTDQLTRAHIQRLQQALHDSTIEAQNEKEQVALLSSELQRLRDELARFRRRDRTKDIELSLSEKFAISPEEPQMLLHNLTSFLPAYSTGKWIAAAAARAGDAWICVTTASGRQEELVFTSHTFDNFLRFRNNSQLKQHDERQLSSDGLVETLSEVLPVEVVHYILTGEQPSRALENSILREYSSDSSMSSYIYHKNTRLPSRGIVLNEFADQRCIIVLSFVCTDVDLRQRPSDIIAEEESAHNDVSMLISGSRFRAGEYDADWDAVLQQCCQLFLAAVVKMLEFREAEQHRFQGMLMSTLEQSLHIPGDNIRCQIQRVLGSVQNLLQTEVSHSLDERTNQPELETIKTVEGNADANVRTSLSSLRDIKEQGLKWNVQCELICTSSQRTLDNGDVSYPVALSLRAEEPLRRLIWLDSQVKSSLAQLGIDEYSLNSDTAIFETDADALTAAVGTALKTQRPALRSFTRLSPLASHPHQSLPQSPSHASMKVAVIRDVETSMRRDQVSFLVLPIAPEDVSEQFVEFDISQARNGGIRLLWLIRLAATSISYSNSTGLNLLRPASVSASVLNRTISSFLHRDVTRTLWSWLRRSHYSPLSIFRYLSLIDEDDPTSSLTCTNTIDEVQAAERLLEFKFSSANKNFGSLTKFVRESMDSDFALVLYLPKRLEQISSLKWLSDEGHLCEEQILSLPASLRKQLQTLIEEYNQQIYKSPRKDHSSLLWSKLSLKGSEQTSDLWLRNDCLSGDRKSLMTLFAFERSQRQKTESKHDLVPQLDLFFDRSDLADSLFDLHAVFFDVSKSDSVDSASRDDANVICILHGRMFRHFPDSEQSNLLHHYYSPLLRVHARLFTLLEARRQAEKLSYQQRAISSLEKSRERTESFRRGLHALARSLSVSCSNEGLAAPLAVADVRRVLCEIISRYLSEEINDVVIATSKHREPIKECLFSSIRCESVLKISIHKTRTIDGQDVCDKRTETKWALIAPDYEWKLQHSSEEPTSTCVFATEIFKESAPKSLENLFPHLVLTVELSLAYTSSDSTVNLCDIWQRFQSSLSFTIWKEELERFISHHREILLLYPPRDSNSRDRMSHEGEDYFFKLSLQALNAAMLSKRRSSKTQAQQLARPYHLHDYLHNPQLLKQLSGSAICDSFLLLPVSRQSSLRRFHLNEEDDDDDEDFSQGDLFSRSDGDALPSYVHLLKLDGKQLRARGMRVLSEQELPLPRRLNRAVAIATSQPLDDTANVDSPVRRLHRTDASVLSILPETAKTMVHYLSDLDVQLQSQFLPLLLGKAQAERFLVSSNVASSTKSSTSNNMMTAFFDDGEDRRGFAESAFSSEKSTVILYSPIYPASARRKRNQSQRDQWAQPWSTHYLLIVRSDRVSSLTSVIQLQRALDAIFRPSLTIATGQSWFECVSGMERLLLASTSLASMLKQQQSSSGRLKTGQRNDSQLKLFNLEEAGGVQHANQQQSQAEKHKQMVKRLISRRSFMHLETADSADESRVTNFGFVSEQFFAEANNILAECMAITKASLGSERYMASAGYLLSPTDLQKFVLQSQLGNASNTTGIVQRQSLLRSFCDTPSQGHTQRWEVGPRKFPCPSTARDIQLLFRRRGASTTRTKFSEQTLKHFFYEAAAPLPGQEFCSSYDRNPFSISALNAFEPQLHCVELSGAQLQRFLHHQQANHGNGDEEATAGFMLRNDITVWLLMITAHVPVVRTANSNSNNGEPAMKVDKSEDLVVASMLIYMQTDALETNAATEQQEDVETDSLSDDFEDSYDEDEESDEENSDSNTDYFDAGAVSNTVVSGSNDESDDVHTFDDSDDLFGVADKPNTLNKTASFTRKPFSSSSVPSSATTPGLTRRPSVMLRMSGNISDNKAGASYGTSARPGMSRRVSFSADVAASLAAAQQNKTNNDSGRKVSTKNKSASRSRSRSRSSSPSSRGDGHIVLGGNSVGMVEKSLGRSLMNGLLRVLDVTASLLSSLFLRRVAEIVHERQIERRVGTIADERDALFSRIRQLHDSMKQNSASSLNSGSSNSSGAASGSAAAQLLGRPSNTPSSSGMVAMTGNSAIDRDRRLAVAGELIALIQRMLDDNRGLQRRAEAAEEQGKDVALRLRQSMSAASDVDRLLSQVVRCVTQLLNSQLHQEEYYKHVLSLQIGPNTIAMPGNDSSPFLQYQQHIHSIASALQTLAFQGVAFRIAQNLLSTSDALGGLHASLIERLRPLALHLQTISLSSTSFTSGSINGLSASLEDFVMRLLRIIEVHLSAVDEDKDAICTMHLRLRTDLALFEHHGDHSSENLDQKRVHDANYSPASTSESIAESIRSVELAVHWIDLSALHHDLLVHRQRQQNEHSKNEGESYDSDDYIESKSLPSVGRDSTHEEEDDGQDIGAITGDARIFPGPLYLFRERAREALSNKKVIRIDGVELYRLSALQQRRQKQKEKRSKIPDDRSADDFESGSILLETLALKGLYVADLFLIPVLPQSVSVDSGTSMDLTIMRGHVAIIQRVFFESRAPSGVGLGLSVSGGSPTHRRPHTNSTDSAEVATVHYDPSQDPALQGILLLVKPLLASLQAHYDKNGYAIEGNANDTVNNMLGSQTARLWRAMTQMLPIETTAASLSSSSSIQSSSAVNDHSTGKQKPRHRSSLLALPGRTMENIMVVSPERKGPKSKDGKSVTSAATSLAKQTVQAFDLFQQFGVHLSDNFCVQVALSASTLLRGTAAFFPLTSDVRNWSTEVVHGLTSFSASGGEPLLAAEVTSKSSNRLRRRLSLLASQQQFDGRDFAVCVSTSSIFQDGHSDSSRTTGICPLHLLVSLIPLQEQNDLSLSSAASKRPKYCVFVVEIARAVGAIDALAMSFLVHLVNNHLHVHASEVAKSRRETELKSLAGSLADTSRQMLHQTELAQCVSFLWRRLLSLQSSSDSIVDSDFVTLVSNRRRNINELRNWIKDGKDLSAVICSNSTSSSKLNFVIAELLSLSSSDSMSIPQIVDMSLEQLDKFVVAQGGEGIISLWHKNVKLCISSGIDGFTGCVARASHYINASVHLATSNSDKGVATVVRTKEFCGSLALRLGCPVVDDLPIAQLSDQQINEFALYIPLLADPTNRNGIIASDEALYAQVKRNMAAKGQNEELLECVSSKWLLVLMFSTSSARDACILAINSLSSAEPNIDISMQQRVPFNANKVKDLFSSISNDVEDISVNTKNVVGYMPPSSSASNNGTQISVMRQSIGGLVYALRQTLSQTRNGLLQKCLLERSILQRSLLSCVTHICHAIVQCDMFFARLHLLCQSVADVAQLLLPTTLSSIAKDNSIDNASLLPKQADFFTHAVLFLQEIMRHSQQDTIEKTKKSHEASDVTLVENREIALRVCSASLHWADKDDWKVCHVSNKQLLLPQANDVEEDEIVDEHRISLLQKVSDNVTDAVGAAYVSPSYLPVNLLTSVATAKSAEISDKPVITRDGGIFRLQNSGSFTILLPQNDGDNTSNVNRDAKLLLGITIPSALHTLAQLPSSGTTSKSSPDGDHLVSYCVLELTLVSNNDDHAGIDWNLLESQSSFTVVEVKKEVQHEEKLQELSEQVSSGLCNILFSHPLTLCRDLRDTLNATVFRDTQARRVALLQQAMALFSLEGNSCRTLLQRFHGLLSHALQPLGCITTRLVVRDTAEDLLLYDHEMSAIAGSLMNYDSETPLFSPTPAPVSQSTRSRTLSPNKARPLSVSQLQPFSPATIRTNINDKNDSRFTFSPSPTKLQNSATTYDKVVRFSVESCFDYHEVSGILTATFSVASTLHPSPESTEAWSLAEALSSMTNTPTPHSSHNHQKVRFTQKTSEMDERGVPSRGAGAKQGNEEVLETLSRALARRAFELHRGAKNKQKMREKQVALSQANAELQAKNEQVETLEATQSLTLSELRDRSIASERTKHSLLSEQKVLKDMLQQKKEMNAHLQKTLAELRKDTDKKEALLVRQVKELKDRLAALESERQKENKELSKAQQKEFAANLQKSEIARQLTDATKAFQSAEQTIRQLKSEIASLEQREKSLAESGDLRLKGFLQRVRALEEDLASARGTNAFLKKQLEAATQQLKTIAEQSGKKLESLQTTMTRSLSLQNMQLQHQLTQSSHVNSPLSRSNSPLPAGSNSASSRHSSPVNLQVSHMFSPKSSTTHNSSNSPFSPTFRGNTTRPKSPSTSAAKSPVTTRISSTRTPIKLRSTGSIDEQRGEIDKEVNFASRDVKFNEEKSDKISIDGDEDKSVEVIVPNINQPLENMNMQPPDEAPSTRRTFYERK